MYLEIIYYFRKCINQKKIDFIGQNGNFKGTVSKLLLEIKAPGIKKITLFKYFCEYL